MLKITKDVSFLLAISISLVVTFVTSCSVTTTSTTSKRQPSQQDSSFVVLADPRGGGNTWINALTQIRDMNATRDFIIAPELIIVAGDMDPIIRRHKDYQSVFASTNMSPLMVPVIGNHEFEDGGVHFRYARDILIPAIPGAVRRHASSCDYYLDHKNVRIIVIDGYTELGKHGVINAKGRDWVEQTIKATPPSIAHIFLAFHEPAFPRIRHIKDSFNQNPDLRNAFWRMLLNYRDRVRAVLVGHTHNYYRMKVLDPAGEEANDPKAYPDENGGIYQIDAGAAGNGKRNTIVQIQTVGPNVLFRVLQARLGANKPFKEIDRWSILSPM